MGTDGREHSMAPELPVVFQWRGQETEWWRDLSASEPVVEKCTVRIHYNMRIMSAITRFFAFY